MVGIIDLLSKDYSDQAYRADNPFYQAGIGIGQIQTAPARNNTEAFLLPFLQNTLAGGLAGYGKQQATQTQYQDISKILAGTNYKPTGGIEYGLEEAPAEFSGKIGLKDLLLAANQEQAQQEAKAKVQAIRDELEVKSSQPFLEQVQKEAEAKEAGKKLGKGPASPEDIPAAVRGQLAEQKAIVDEAVSLGTTLVESGKNWGSLRGAEMFAGLDDDGVAARIADLGDRVIRTRSGATAPPEEAKKLQKIISGDRSVTPQEAGKLILKFAERERANAKSQVDLLTGDITTAFDAPPSQQVGRNTPPPPLPGESREAYKARLKGS